MTLQRTSINGVELAYRIDGALDRPWVVLVNGLATDHRLWDLQMPSLAASFRIMRYDTRGHGASSATAAPYSLDLLVSDLVGLMDHVGINQTHVIGLSLGGVTAMGMALSHADRVSSLVCCDARADAPPPYVAFWKSKIAAVRQLGLAGVVDETLARWFTEPGIAESANQPMLNLARDMILATSVEGYCGCATALTELNYLPQLSTLSMPVHFVVGAKDTAAPQQVMSAMASATPSGCLDVIERAAHMPNLEQPETFNAALTRTLKSNILKNSPLIP
jgi:3-oxoadipate enol-lactonase